MVSVLVCVAASRGASEATMDDIERAKTIIRDLEAKRGAVIERREAISVELQRLGYDAHAAGDAKAAARVVKLTAELAALAGDQTSLDAAFIEAGKRLSA